MPCGEGQGWGNPRAAGTREPGESGDSLAAPLHLMPQAWKVQVPGQLERGDGDSATGSVSAPTGLPGGQGAG